MSDLRQYPEGRGSVQSRYVRDVFVEFGVGKRLRTRLTIAQVNAGTALLPALPGVRWQLLDAFVIAVGGAVTSVTTVDINGILSGSSRKLVAFAQAALTQSTLLRAGAANATILADGASFTQNDANAAVSAFITGSAITVATNLDFFLEYQAVAA